MPKLETKQEGPYYWRFDQECFPELSAECFGAKYWQDKNAVNGKESGRGTTWFVQHGEHSLVLRHYLRGGLVSKLNKDSYLFKNWQSTRSVEEFNILHDLHEQGFPVPKPAAAQVLKKGLYYQADLLTHRIPGAADLVQVLQSAQEPEFYHQLGKLIARFHTQGVFHADLNIQNILRDEHGQFWLIDFDRAAVLPCKEAWQINNLKRLKRSFEKEVERHQIQWQQEDWQALISAYREENPIRWP